MPDVRQFQASWEGDMVCQLATNWGTLFSYVCFLSKGGKWHEKPTLFALPVRPGYSEPHPWEDQAEPTNGHETKPPKEKKIWGIRGRGRGTVSPRKAKVGTFVS